MIFTTIRERMPEGSNAILIYTNNIFGKIALIVEPLDKGKNAVYWDDGRRRICNDEDLDKWCEDITRYVYIKTFSFHNVAKAEIK